MGSSRFARRYSGNRIFFLFLQVLRCFSSLRLSSSRYVFTCRYYPIKDSGFPHSEIPGSKLTYSSPRHIGVSAVLHRLLVPRHPPCALINLTVGFQYTAYFVVSCIRSFSHVHRYAPSFTQLLPRTTCVLKSLISYYISYKRYDLRTCTINFLIYVCLLLINVVLSSFQRTNWWSLAGSNR